MPDLQPHEMTFPELENHARILFLAAEMAKEPRQAVVLDRELWLTALLLDDHRWGRSRKAVRR